MASVLVHAVSFFQHPIEWTEKLLEFRKWSTLKQENTINQGNQFRGLQVIIVLGVNGKVCNKQFQCMQCIFYYKHSTSYIAFADHSFFITVGRNWFSYNSLKLNYQKNDTLYFSFQCMQGNSANGIKLRDIDRVGSKYELKLQEESYRIT